MTDKPINLNRFRKARLRDERRQKADENAVRFGRTKAERKRDADETGRIEKALDGARRDDK